MQRKSHNTCLLCRTVITSNVWRIDHLIQLKERQQRLCMQCYAGFKKIPDHNTCLICEKYNSLEICNDCIGWQQRGRKRLNNRAIYRYNELAKTFMKEYKFNGRYELRHIFQQELSQLILQQEAQLVVPIPVSKYTLLTRGFNQVEGLLEKINYSNVLSCKDEMKSVQSLKTRFDRINMVQPFYLTGNVNEIVGINICLVDDVYTTGSTLYHAAQCLYDNGARNVCSVTLIR